MQGLGQVPRLGEEDAAETHEKKETRFNKKGQLDRNWVYGLSAGSLLGFIFGTFFAIASLGDAARNFPG